MGYFVPELLKNKINWNVWEKETKQPYYIRQGNTGFKFVAGGHTTKSKCVDYETAVFALDNSDFGGIGFCFFKEDNLTFIDLDNCVYEDGEISELAEEVLGMFSDTYVELSQSERGLHIIALGTIPRAIKRKEIEIYSEGRYVAFTGNAWNASEPCEHQAEIDELFKRFSEPTARLNSVSAGDIQETSSELQNVDLSHLSEQVGEMLDLIKKSRQGLKFEALHAGKWNRKEYFSQSEAEQAYINIVSYFAGYDYELVKAIYVQSELYNRRKNRTRLDYLLRRMFENAKATAQGTKTGRVFKVKADPLEELKERRNKVLLSSKSPEKH